MIGDGRSGEDKAIWVVRGGNVRIENIEFRGARAADGKGAAIRFEKGLLKPPGIGAPPEATKRSCLSELGLSCSISKLPRVSDKYR